MMTVQIRRRTYSVADFAAAARLVDRIRDASGVGSSRFSGGVIFFSGEKVARVSYNGRIWCDRCEGEIDAPANLQFPSSKGDCKCGNTSHAPALASAVA